MANAGFYNANEHRAYPLTDVPVAAIPLPDPTLVDFGCVVGLRAGFVDGRDRVWLYRVARAGGTVAFEFRSDAPVLAGRALAFERQLGDPEYALSFATDAGAGGSSSSLPGGDCVDDPLLEGFLVTGDLAPVFAALADGEEWVDADGAQPVEPALLQNLARTYVRQVSLANQPRTTVDPPDGCSASSAVPDDGAVRVAAACLTGALKFKEGYNCAIRVARQDNSVTIAGAVGAGEGEACEEVPAYPGETPPPGSGLLTGGPACDEVLKSINGVGGRVVRLQAGDGVRVAPGDAPNTLVIEADLRGMALCAPLVESSVGG